MRWMVVLVLSLVAACSPAERMSYQVVGAGVAYDTVKEDKVPGGYRAQGVYDSAKAGKGEISPDEVKWRALYKGLEAVQKDGYEFATIAGPAGTTLKRSVSYSGSATSYTTHQWPGFAYIIRGYKTNETRPANAQPITKLMEESNRRAFAAAKPTAK